MIVDQTVADNVLVAEFMGGGFRTVNIDGKGVEKFYFQGAGTRDYVNLSNLCYSESWDWLMPVVEKIEEMKYWVNIHLNKCEIDDTNTPGFPTIISIGNDEADTKIEAVWKAVVAFIKWYNETKAVK